MGAPIYTTDSKLVILANAGNHGTESAVGWSYCLTIGKCYWPCVRLPLCVFVLTHSSVCVDKWFPVCTGMTIGGVVAES
ncbi:hypothetical protein P0J05_002900 [Vibrio vulnificus]|nr:hypothetical protein [Vibrio vulnificus]HDY7788675.1 hypothetical protein [Vibrio vulnificus]